MDVVKNEATEILDFVSYIKKYYPYYIVDGNNIKTLTNLGLWAMRDPKFNGIEKGWHIDRGLLLYGRSGVGKDEMFRLLRTYLSYLRSPYGYIFKVVWKFAKLFTESGWTCFQEDEGNIYYEELALTSELNGSPDREMVSHFGNKTLLGAEIVHIRYPVFKQTAYQTHFSTNLNEDQLEKVYGQRVMSRLYEMCNFIPVLGSDHRGKSNPEFLSNKMTPKMVGPRETTIQEHESNKISLEQHYQDFLFGRPPSTSLAFVYNLLVSYNVQVATQEQLQDIVGICSEQILADNPSLVRATPREREEQRRLKIWEQARETAVVTFFQRLKEGGCKSIFGEREIQKPEDILSQK